MQDSTVFKYFVHVQDENQAGGARSPGIVPRKRSQADGNLCSLQRISHDSIMLAGALNLDKNPGRSYS